MKLCSFCGQHIPDSDQVCDSLVCQALSVDPEGGKPAFRRIGICPMCETFTQIKEVGVCPDCIAKEVTA